MRLCHPAAQTILLDRALSLADAALVADGGCRIMLAPAARDRCAAAHERLSAIIADERHVHGITTGFGPLANRLVAAADGALLQQNLVNHLATGVGPYFGGRG